MEKPGKNSKLNNKSKGKEEIISKQTTIKNSLPPYLRETKSGLCVACVVKPNSKVTQLTGKFLVY